VRASTGSITCRTLPRYPKQSFSQSAQVPCAEPAAAAPAASDAADFGDAGMPVMVDDSGEDDEDERPLSVPAARKRMPTASAAASAPGSLGAESANPDAQPADRAATDRVPAGRASPDQIGTGMGSPKSTRFAPDLAEMSAPGTGRGNRLKQRLEQSESRCGELEAALQAAEAALSSSRVEVERLAAGVAVSSNTGGASGTRLDFDEGDSSDAVSSEGEGEGEVNASPEEGEQPAVAAWQGIFSAAAAKTTAAKTAKSAAESAARAKQQVDLPAELRPVEAWSLVTFKKMEGEIGKKRRVPVRAGTEAPKPRKGRFGAMHHDRMGLVGALQYWARGSKSNAECLVLKLIRHFDVGDAVRAELFQKVRREAETDKVIVDRLVEALDVLKGCQTEQQRLDYALALSLVAPVPAEERDQSGHERRVAARLRVLRRRAGRKAKRQYAFQKAIQRRAKFDAAAQQFHPFVGPLRNGQHRALVADPLQVGDRVLTQTQTQTQTQT